MYVGAVCVGECVCACMFCLCMCVHVCACVCMSVCLLCVCACMCAYVCVQMHWTRHACVRTCVRTLPRITLLWRHYPHRDAFPCLAPMRIDSYTWPPNIRTKPMELVWHTLLRAPPMPQNAKASPSTPRNLTTVSSHQNSMTEKGPHLHMDNTPPPITPHRFRGSVL
jgi:hypothetical protein